MQVLVAVPQRYGFGARDAYGPQAVLVVERAGKGDDSDTSSHFDSSAFSTFTVKSSMTVLARNVSAIS